MRMRLASSSGVERRSSVCRMRLAVAEDAAPAAGPPAARCGDGSEDDIATSACDCCARAAADGVGGGRPMLLDAASPRGGRILP